VEEPRSELEVVSRCTHGDGEHLTINPNLEGFFNRKIVEDGSVLSVIPLDDFGRLHALRRMAHGGGVHKKRMLAS
jgi:hypothetical protein